jgi:hypothetical protein
MVFAGSGWVVMLKQWNRATDDNQPVARFQSFTLVHSAKETWPGDYAISVY